MELGEVLIVLEGQTDLVKDGPGDRNPTSTGQDEGSSLATSSRHVVRVASPADLASSRDAEDLRPSRFSLCQRILREGNWPWDLIDVEPLLDGSATVLHYLGPRQVEAAPLRARFRVEFDFDVILEPLGTDPGGEDSNGDAHDHQDGGGCGSCGCSDGGGCGSGSRAVPGDHHEHAEPVASGCVPESRSGCSSCGISRLMAERSRA